MKPKFFENREFLEDREIFPENREISRKSGNISRDPESLEKFPENRDFSEFPGREIWLKNRRNRDCQHYIEFSFVPHKSKKPTLIPRSSTSKLMIIYPSALRASGINKF